MKTFIDGTPIPADYMKKIGRLIDDVCRAEELFTLDELEEYARNMQADKRDGVSSGVKLKKQDS